MKIMTINIISIVLISLSTGCSESNSDHIDKFSNKANHKESVVKKGEGSKEHEADGHGHDEDGKSGEKKAVTKADEQKGIQLAHHVGKLLRIKTNPIRAYASGKYTFRVPKTSLVYFEDKTGVYYKRNNWYNLEHVKSYGRKGNTILISTRHLLKTDQLVTIGVPLLRLAHLEAFGASGEGHGH